MQHKSIRQNMAWLHSWTGLLLGWLLFTIFLTGSLSYYRHNISLWMQPELANIEVNQDKAIHSAYHYLQENAPNAKNWYIQLANKTNPVTQIYWQKADQSYGNGTLNPNTGAAIKISQGGDFFYNFHFQLYAVPFLIGRIICSFAALVMLIALISGIITHKKILIEFFTLRTFKSQRSWLDFHNVCSVIALPFFLLVTFTGIMIFSYIYLPWSIQKLYPNNSFQYFDDINTKVLVNNTVTTPAKMLSIQELLKKSKTVIANDQLDTISVQNPNTHAAQITFIPKNEQSIVLSKYQVSLNAVDGHIIGNTKNQSHIATLNSAVYGLHMATFAQPFLRIALFFSGILGCLMIASGLLLWSLKRQLQQKQPSFHFGYYLVDRLNIATFIGLPIAILTYFYINRTLLWIPDLPLTEIQAFLSIWLLCFMISLLIKKQNLWSIFLKVFILFAFLLPIYDLVLLNILHKIYGIVAYWMMIKVDLFFWIFAGFACFLHYKIHPIQQHSKHKILNKLKENKHGGNAA